MSKSFVMLLVLLSALSVCKHVTAQDSDEVARLKDEVARLNREVELLKRENGLLKRENEVLKRESELLKANGPAKPKQQANAKANVADKDLFAEGNSFGGEQVLRDARGKIVNRVKWALQIAERKGTAFKGILTFPAGNYEYEVTGTAPVSAGGVVKFNGEKGLSNLRIIGKLKDGEVGVEFAGRGPAGSVGRGTGYFRPNN